MNAHFPYESALLPRTKLSYVNLPGLLDDGKRDRAARVPAYVVLALGESCYLVFLREGEPFHAGYLGGRGRGVLPIAEVLRLAAAHGEHGEAGQIGFYTASEAQLRAMLATLLQPPLPLDPADGAAPERLFPLLREQRFSGVLELAGAQGRHYLCFAEGGFSDGYFSGREPGVPTGRFVHTLFATPGGPRPALYPALGELPRQAPPGLVALYRSLMEAVLREVGGRLGLEEAVAVLRRTSAALQPRHPVLRGLQVSAAGGVEGETADSPDDLTAGIAAWLVDFLVHAREHAGTDPGAVLERLLRDHRYALAEQRFFQRLPWPVAP